MVNADQNAQSINRGYWTNPLVVTVSAVLVFFAAQFTGVLLVAPLSLYTKNETYQLLAIITCNVLVLFALLSTAKRVIKFSWNSLGLTKPSTKSLLWILPAFLVYFIASATLTALAAKLIPHFNVNQAQDVGFTNLKRPFELIAAFVSLSILTPIVEETIFRGILFKGLRRRLPFWMSAVVTSLVFAIAHMQLNVAVDVFALSLVLCYLVEKTDSVVPGMVLHGIKNSLAFILLFVLK